MADDRNKRGAVDRDRVNIHEEYEVIYWTEKFDCTKVELIEAVKHAGVMAEHVKDYLKEVKGR